MLKYLHPNMYVCSVNRIDLEALKRNGIKGLIIDLDNTLLPWRDRKANSFFVETLERLTSNGFKVCILSNARDGRVGQLFDPLNIPSISRAGKPRKSAFKRALEVLGTSVEESAVIGDQVFTDVLGGNRLGLFTILVIPISRKEFFGTRIARRVENKVLSHFIEKGSLERPKY